MPTKDYIAGYDDRYNGRSWEEGLKNSLSPFSYKDGYNTCCDEWFNGEGKIVNCLEFAVKMYNLN